MKSLARRLVQSGLAGLVLLVGACTPTSEFFDPALAGTWQHRTEGEPDEELQLGSAGTFVRQTDPGDEGYATQVEGIAHTAGGRLTVAYPRNDGEAGRQEQELTSSYTVFGDRLCFDHCVAFARTGQFLSRSWYLRNFVEDAGGRREDEELWTEEVELREAGECRYTRGRSSRSTRSGTVVEDHPYETTSQVCQYQYREADDSYTITGTPDGPEDQLTLTRLGAGWVAHEEEDQLFRKIAEP